MLGSSSNLQNDNISKASKQSSNDTNQIQQDDLDDDIPF